MNEITEIKEMLSAGIKKMYCASMPGKPARDCGPIQISVHNMIEFLFVIHGRSRFLLNQKLFSIEAGDLLIIDSWDPHALGYFPDDHDLIHLWVHLCLHNCYVTFGQIKQPGDAVPILYPFSLAYDITDFVRRRCKMAREPDGFMTESSVERYLRTPLNMLLDEVLISLKKDPADGAGGAGINIIESIKSYIQSTNGCQCSLSQLEKYTGYSKYYISHLFKSETGISIGEYVNEIRIKYTAEAELYGEKHRDIAQEIGFSSNSVFCQWLRRYKDRIDEVKKSIKNNSSMGRRKFEG